MSMRENDQFQLIQDLAGILRLESLREPHKIVLCAMLTHDADPCEQGYLLHQKNSMTLHSWTGLSEKRIKDVFLELVEKQILHYGEQETWVIHRKSLFTASPSTRTTKLDDPLHAIRVDAWNTYNQSYQQRYQVEPLRNLKVNSMLKKATQEMGADVVPLIAFYVSMNDPFFVKNAHPMGLFLSQLDRIRVAWERSKQDQTSQGVAQPLHQIDSRTVENLSSMAVPVHRTFRGF